MLRPISVDFYFITQLLKRIVMQLQDIEDAWNKQADEYNQWFDLGSDEKVEFTIKYVREVSAEICRETGKYSDCIDMALRCADAIVDA